MQAHLSLYLRNSTYFLLQSINPKAKLPYHLSCPKEKIYCQKKISLKNKVFCKNKKFFFIDSTSAFTIINDKVNQSLFFDKIRLNKESSTALGRQISAGMRKIISTTSREQINRPSREHKNFQKCPMYRITIQHPFTIYDINKVHVYITRRSVFHDVVCTFNPNESVQRL
jgi:hypothetical protein